ncbi:hypothetical protein MT1_3724 [Pseudomonas sp. MT-1]|uniref:hypothetical protein n=1 Tax=Stutzerimonas stutzeri TaxID=316 RepID=UPI000535E939|nr:hypothetical protein [Stutzerimonas stutzeri]MCQ4282549.1 hypothetical protein [Stutzerimonas stutzeri]BAP80899.1 hypothetical protein MT1_3724 [Pseudomonas sp. MT-1]
MTLFTDGLIIRKDRNILDDVVTGQFDAAEASFDQAMFENPTSAVRRIGELNRAEDGRVEMQAYPAYGIQERRAEPETPLLTAEQARARIKEEGLDLTVEDSGIRAGALDILIERKREEVKRKLILDNAPSSTIPVQLLAGFGASVLDPINIASAFVPIVGEARYASMLARAGTSVAARAAVRAQVGAVEGAVGAAIVEPLVLYASAQDQADYGAVDSLLNVAFGSVMGGGLHSAGGYISDVRRGTLLEGVKAESPAITGQAPEKISPQQFALRVDEDPMLALRDSLERGIQGDRARMAEDAGRQARETLMPEIRAELQEIASGKLPNVRDLKIEQGAIQAKIDTLDDTFKARAKEFQGQRMSRKQAERAARDSIAEERQRLTERKAEIESATDVNRQAEIARGELNALQRGEIPQRYQSRIDAETGRITSGFDLRHTARAKAEAAPWQVRESALRTAIAQSVTGRPVNVEAIFDLADPNKRAAALQRLKEPVEAVADPEGEVASYAAGETADALDGTDLEGVERMLVDEQALTDEMAAQAGIDLKPFMREADELAADAETYAAAYRAAALCQLRN